ncbi:MAG: class I SAM-dependent methyltransferase [Myxococcales bacterium]|nr:class I SAM-dependent methyltransferase [Myxococcales bacterium]
MEESYWNGFYAREHQGLDRPSTFAVWSAERLAPGTSLFELGCGNGRDALFFAAQGHKVVACDTSETAVAVLNDRIRSCKFTHVPVFLRGDMGALAETFSGELDVAYSRFTLHAVDARTASRALRWSRERLRAGGRLFLEARSVKGSLYGQGAEVERDAFIHDGHYRRFLRADELTVELEGLGFVIRDLVEASGLAVHGGDDPVVIRVIAEVAAV